MIEPVGISSLHMWISTHRQAKFFKRILGVLKVGSGPGQLFFPLCQDRDELDEDLMNPSLHGFCNTFQEAAAAIWVSFSRSSQPRRDARGSKGEVPHVCDPSLNHEPPALADRFAKMDRDQKRNISSSLLLSFLFLLPFPSVLYGLIVCCTRRSSLFLLEF